MQKHTWSYTLSSFVINANHLYWYIIQHLLLLTLCPPAHSYRYDCATELCCPCRKLRAFNKLTAFLTMPWRRQWHPTPGLLPGQFHGWKSLVGCSPWGHYQSDTTERLHFHFSLSCIGEGNGNPLQCSCLENPRDGGAWWAAVYGVTQSWTRLKWLSSSSSYNAFCSQI